MAGHGGGAWKVAYADFVTAMMAFFMVMWITAQSKPVKKAISQYFSDPSGQSWKKGGALSVVPGNKHGEVPNSKSRVKVAAPPKEDPKGDLVKVKAAQRSRVAIHKLDAQSAIGGVLDFQEQVSELNSPRRTKLKSVAADLAGKPQIVEILGRISNRPLAGAGKQSDQWDLAYARCRQIAAELESLGIDPQRLRLVVSQANARSRFLEPPTDRPDCRVEVFLTDKFVETE
jgi:chemotaxis protein MotB